MNGLQSPGAVALISSLTTILIGIMTQWVIRRNKTSELEVGVKKTVDEIYTALVQGSLKDMSDEMKLHKKRIDELERLESLRSFRQNRILLKLEAIRSQILSLKVKLTTYSILREAGQDTDAINHFKRLVDEIDEITDSIDGLSSISDVTDDNGVLKDKDRGGGDGAL